ncbi:MAG: hypothetical protein ABI910_20975, partial [Gemmatimonadota bacterium]
MATYARPSATEAPPFAFALSRVRLRWRWRHAAVGLAVTFGVAVVGLWGAAVALQAARFSPESVSLARWLLAALLVGTAGRWLAYPLVRRVPDRRIALYLEERVPDLDGAVISAVEVAETDVSDEARSTLLTRGLFDDAARRMTRSTAVGQLEQTTTWRALALSAVLLASAAAMIALGPSWVGQAARLLLTPWHDVAAAPVYAIDVKPGNATIARGSDFEVSARLLGFSSDVVELSIRRGANGEWERVPMGPSADSGRFSARLFDLGDDAEYYVESNGVRSPPYKLTVKDLPAVRRMDLELHYPAYTGLAVEQFEDVGDIAAVKGARAVVSVRATRAVHGGRIVLDGDSTVALTLVDDSTLTASVTVRRDGFYRVELD